MKPLDDHECRVAEVLARSIVRSEADLSDNLVLPPQVILLARAHVTLLGQVRALHDLVDQIDPSDPVGSALTKVGLTRRPTELSVVPTTRMVKELRPEQLLALYCHTMRETADVFVKYASYVVRVWDGMDGCWTDCTGEVGRDEPLQYWAEKTDGGTHHVSYSEIDYYRIFPGGTRMMWDGSEGREMHR